MIGFLLFRQALLTMIPHITKIQPWTPKIYNVTIGTSPKQKWAPIVNDHKQALDTFIKRFEYLPIPDFVFNFLAWWGKNFFIHQDFIKQVQGLAQVYNYPLGKLLFLNFMYQYSTAKACSGILIRDNLGRILHGRNLDFQMFGMLSKLVVTINYFEKNQLVYTANYIVGSVFVLTGLRHGAYAISQDTRKAQNFLSVIKSLFLGDGIPSPWLISRILATQATFENAVRRLNYSQISAPTYYIISGVKGNQGAVIQRDPKGINGFYQLNDNRWYLVQTNYDRDIPDPPKDYRRIPAQQRIQKISQTQFTQHILLQNVMKQWPTFNIGTIYTAIMVPHDSYFTTTVWYCAPKDVTQM